MLSRKASDFIFYGIFAVIFLAVVFVRVSLINSVNDRIDSVEASNTTLELQIAQIGTLVDENKNQQLNNLYQMYEKIPAEYDRTDLIFYTYAKLEQVGVNSAPEYSRYIEVDETVTFPPNSEFIDLQENFIIVEVQVSFTTLDVDQVIQFLDEIFNSEQLFIINSLEYNVPEDQFSLIGIEVSFLAIYEKNTD
ncbi:MAG: hypothetical protein QM489_07045 [Candidatus Izemoplasma sp.]